jgi:hypothetical protein
MFGHMAPFTWTLPVFRNQEISYKNTGFFLKQSELHMPSFPTEDSFPTHPGLLSGPLAWLHQTFTLGLAPSDFHTGCPTQDCQVCKDGREHLSHMRQDCGVISMFPKCAEAAEESWAGRAVGPAQGASPWYHLSSTHDLGWRIDDKQVPAQTWGLRTTLDHAGPCYSFFRQSLRGGKGPAQTV